MTESLSPVQTSEFPPSVTPQKKSQDPKRSLMKPLVTVLIIAITLTVLAFGFLTNRNKPNPSFVNTLQNLNPQKIATENSPSGFPFEELTIPYLKNRTYTSSLGSMDQISTNSSYTTYLTSYDSDSLRINGLLTVPTGEAPPEGFPAVVFIHGYIPPTMYRTTENYSSYVDYLARQGLVVFKIDLRGHGTSEGEATGAYYSSDYVIDTLNAYSALQNAENVNSKRVGLWGHSMAGNVVFRSIAVKPEIPKAVIWAGAGYTYQDLREYRISDYSYRPPETDTERARRRRELNDTHGEFDPNHWFWKQVPGTNYLEDIKGSIQIHHAVNDDVVSIDYTKNLMKILDGTSIPHQSFEYQNGAHNLVGDAFSQAMSRTAEFLTE